MSKKKVGAIPRIAVPPGIDQQGCQIIFGHNVSIRKVLMQFSVSAERLLFSPEEARDVATKLQHYAAMAEGKKVQG